MPKLVSVRNSAASALLTLVVLGGAAMTLSACNTARGFGEDMSAAGHAVSNWLTGSCMARTTRAARTRPPGNNRRGPALNGSAPG